MSILDALKNVDPATAQGLLQMGLSMLQSKGNLGNAIGQGGMAGIQGAQQFKDRQAQTQQRGLMEQLQKQQLASGQRQQQLDALPQQFYRAPSAQGVDATGGMETADTNPANAFNPQGSFDERGYQQALMGMSPMQGLQFKAATAKQRPELKAFKPGDVVGAQDASGAFKEQFRVPDKADGGTSDMQNYAAVKAQGYKGTLSDFLKEQANLKAPRTVNNVAVNTGQKGFDNTLKLRGDFRSEPIYKAHQEVQSAHSQIKQALGMASPAGDLAGATKIMKILDPGSVVRESELGMAMAASGLMDRVQNYAQNIIKGTKLTPTQRADFMKLADALNNESVKQYNSKRGEYKGIADRNQLNVADVLGDEMSGGKTVNFGDLR